MQKHQRKNIILTGFMGTGKTTVGKLLAAQLGYKFVDTDELIQTRQKRSIPEIFAESGEGTFRAMEREIAQELAAQEGLLISTGGGMMLDPANVTALAQKGQIFCLVATPEEILARIMSDPGRVERPLLARPNPGQRIIELLAERAEGYGRFPQIITSGKSPREVAHEMIELYQNNTPASVVN